MGMRTNVHDFRGERLHERCCGNDLFRFAAHHACQCAGLGTAWPTSHTCVQKPCAGVLECGSGRAALVGMPRGHVDPDQTRLNSTGL